MSRFGNIAGTSRFTRRPPNKLATTTHLNELADALGAPTGSLGFGAVGDPLGPDWIFWGEVVNKGPKGEADFTNEIHWVECKFVGMSSAGTALDLGIEQNIIKPSTVAVTNFAGRFAGTNAGQGGHFPIQGQFVPVHRMIVANGDHKAVARFCMWAVPPVVPVLLLTDGGTDGSQTTKPSYTYSLTIDGTAATALATHVSPSFQRSNGTFLSAGIGFAVYQSGGWKLWWADEVPNTGACSA